MDGFKTLPKMAHFKEGGHVKHEEKKCSGGAMKKGGHFKEGGKADLAQDKKLIKKAFKEHDEAEHDKEPTEIKLKKGGRDKKKEGTVKKYKAGGNVNEKKPSGDAVKLEKVKPTGDKKAEAKSEATKRPSSRASDVEKEKGKKAGDVDKFEKVAPTGDKKADSESAAIKDGSTGYKKGHTVKKHKAGGKTKHFADGKSTGTPADITDQIARSQAYRAQQAQQALEAQNAPGGPGYVQQQQNQQLAQQAAQQPKPVPAMSNLTAQQIQQIVSSPRFQAISKMFPGR